MSNHLTFTTIPATPEETLEAIKAMMIQQQGYLQAILLAVVQLQPRAGLHPSEFITAIQAAVPGHVAEAARQFDEYVLHARIRGIQNEPDSLAPNA